MAEYGWSLPPAIQEKARKELNEIPSHRKEAIQALRDQLITRPDVGKCFCKHSPKCPYAETRLDVMQLMGAPLGVEFEQVGRRSIFSCAVSRCIMEKCVVQIIGNVLWHNNSDFLIVWLVSDCSIHHDCVWLAYISRLPYVFVLSSSFSVTRHQMMKVAKVVQYLSCIMI